jgi:F0F1-type ATP synthase beta subunit
MLLKSSPAFKGEYVPVAETVESIEALINGELDEVPEQAFLNVGSSRAGVRQGEDSCRRMHNV